MSVLAASVPAGTQAKEPPSRPIPLVFEPNTGQAGSDIRYVARSGRLTVLAKEDESVLSLRGPAGPQTVSLRLAGSLPSTAEACDRQPGVSNYLLGDRERWRTNVPHYAKIRYRNVYPGIDWVYYGKDGALEYDFVVSPTSDPSQIRLQIDGARELSVNSGGDLIIRLNDGELIHRAPVLFQNTSAGRKSVEGRYVLRARNEVGFFVADYDTTKPLVIDPVLAYSTYVGGTGGADGDSGRSIATDAAGNSYITGQTFTNAGLATPGTVQTAPGGGAVQDAFVAKLSPSGAILFATYFGGSGVDEGLAIALAEDASIYVAGYTTSILPTMNAIRNTPVGMDGFLLRLNNTGTAILQFTYLGGAGTDAANGIALDGGSVYVGGQTSSTDWTSTLNTPAGGVEGWVAKITGSSLGWVRFVGGTGDDWINAVTARAGTVYVAGETRSATVAALQPNALSGSSDGFVLALTTDGAPVFGRRLGGSATDIAYAIAVDTLGRSYVGGETTSTDFPVQAAPGTGPQGNGDGFLSVVDASGSLTYSAFIGGAGTDAVRGVALDRDTAAGLVFLAGSTTSANMLYTNPLMTRGNLDGFVMGLRTSSNTILYSTSIGGTGNDFAYALAVTLTGKVFVTGLTISPIMTGATNTFSGIQDAFVVRIDPGPFRTLTWQNTATRQAVLWYMGGAQGNVIQNWGWVAPDAVPGWSIVARADFDKDGTPDVVWQNDATRQVSVWYLGGGQGNTYLGFEWISSAAVPGWHIVAAADLNGDTRPDLIWQNDTTGQASVWYMGGTKGNAFVSSGWLASMDLPEWRLTAVADLDANGKPDLIWQHRTTHQVSYWLMTGTLGNIVAGTGWISSTPIPDWSVVGATDVNADGKVDLIWQHDTTQQASVWYMGGPQGTTFVMSNWIAPGGVNGWRILAP